MQSGQKFVPNIDPRILLMMMVMVVVVVVVVVIVVVVAVVVVVVVIMGIVADRLTRHPQSQWWP